MSKVGIQIKLSTMQYKSMFSQGYVKSSNGRKVGGGVTTRDKGAG